MEFKGTKGMQVEMHPRLVDTYIVSRPGFHYDPKRKERKANERLFENAEKMLEMINKLTSANPIHEDYHALKLQAIQLIKEATEL